VYGAKAMAQTRPSVKRPIMSPVMWPNQLSISHTAISWVNLSRARSSARLGKHTVLMQSKRFSRWYMTSDSTSRRHPFDSELNTVLFELLSDRGKIL
jgi:hypothetical protein